MTSRLKLGLTLLLMTFTIGCGGSKGTIVKYAPAPRFVLTSYQSGVYTLYDSGTGKCWFIFNGSGITETESRVCQ